MGNKSIVILASLLTLGAMSLSASAASAAQQLWQNKATTILQNEGANITLQNEGVVEFNGGAAVIVVNCKTSFVGATIMRNTPAVDLLSVNAVSFAQCFDQKGNEVEIQTKTAAPWILEWTAGGTFRLLNVQAIIKDPALALPACKVGNAAAAFNFNTPVAPAPLMLAAPAQALEPEAASCPGVLALTETGLYKVVAAPGPENDVFVK
jgi:hypothetical protein